MITLEEASDHIGEAVAYHPAGGKPEHGTIAGASTVYVFVQYPGERGTRATYPEDLTLIAEAGQVQADEEDCGCGLGAARCRAAEDGDLGG